MATSLYGETKQVPMLSTGERQRMFELMLLYYDGMNLEQFEADLTEKQAVMLMRDTSHKIIGFSTCMILDLTVDGIEIKGFFSGDTIVHEAYRKTTLLAAELGKNFLMLLRESPNIPCYWMLISKGCRTYCLLPLFFNEWYPRFNDITPTYAKRIMEVFAEMKYPKQYDRERGIIAFQGITEALKLRVADADELRLQNPHVRFFAERNPNHMQGDELVCLAHIAVENFSKVFLRILRQAGVAYA